MTEVELEILRLRLRVEVHQELLRGLYTGLANSSPTAAQVFRDQFAILHQERFKNRDSKSSASDIGHDCC
jgi:hypothetical protein